MRSNPAAPTRETDLYGPLRDHLLARGYTVRSEVMGVDVVAQRGEEIVVFELKRALNLSLVAQAVDRQRAFDSVYVVVPHPGKRTRTGEWRSSCRVLRRLEIGLVLIDFRSEEVGPEVSVAFHPQVAQRRSRKDIRRAVISEVQGRSADLNLGGSTRTKIVTAYRESAIDIACCLDACGPLAPARLKEMGTSSKTGSILAHNYYKWFLKVSHGIYALTDRGREELALYPDLVSRYRREKVEPATGEEETT